MDSSAIPVFLAGPYPVLHTARVLAEVDEVELDVGLIIEGQPMILASTRFSLDDTWERIRVALASGDARLGVAGMPHIEENVIGQDEEYPSAYIGLECANGERLVLAHIRGLDQSQKPEAYAREVIGSLLDGLSPDELGETIED
ncbi:MAG TPA: hypothetical protein VGC44_09535 [Longimicrobiales bacterium]